MTARTSASRIASISRSVSTSNTARGVPAAHQTVAKRRSDLFRHWLIGFGSGDLLVRTAGAHGQQFEMRNVLFVESKLQLIQDMLQTSEVVSGA